MTPLELKLRRVAKRPLYTIGHLYDCSEATPRMLCDTIEDTDRALTLSMSEALIRQKKIYGKTAIPAGRYRVLMNTESPSYKLKAAKDAYYRPYVRMPRLRPASCPQKEIPGWQGVLIHPGTDQDSSLGCIIVGENKVVGKVINSRKTFTSLYALLDAAHKAGREIYLTIL